MRSLTYDNANDTLYGIDQNQHLVTVDRTTRVATVVAGLAISNLDGLAYDPQSGLLYAVQFSTAVATPSNLVSIDPATGTTNSPGTVPQYLTVLAFDTQNNTLYGVDTSDSSLYAVNPASGTAIAVSSPAAFTSIASLTYDAKADRLYATGRNADNDGNIVIAFDPDTGAASYQAALGLFPVGGMAYDPATSTLYASDPSGGQLFRIDTADAAPIRIGALGFTDVEGLAWDGKTSILYGVDNATDQLISIDTASGAGTAIGSTGSHDFHSLAYNAGNDTLYAVDVTTDTLYAIDKTTAAAGNPVALSQSGIESLTYDGDNQTLYASNDDGKGTGMLLKFSGSDMAVMGRTGFAVMTALAYDPSAGQLIGNDAGATVLIDIDPATGRGHGLHHTGYFTVDGLTYDPAARRHFAVGGDQLVSLDPSSGEGTTIGPFGTSTVGSLAYDPNARVLYGYEINTHNLLTVDTATGAGTVVGDTGVSGLALGYDSTSNKLYGHADRQLYIVEPTTAAVTPIGAPAAVNIRDLAYDPANDTLYGISETDGTQLYTIDPTSGALTLMQTYDYSMTSLSIR